MIYTERKLQGSPCICPEQEEKLYKIDRAYYLYDRRVMNLRRYAPRGTTPGRSEVLNGGLYE